jgi:hypothetical protein
MRLCSGPINHGRFAWRRGACDPNYGRHTPRLVSLTFTAAGKRRLHFVSYCTVSVTTVLWLRLPEVPVTVSV